MRFIQAWSRLEETDCESAEVNDNCNISAHLPSLAWVLRANCPGGHFRIFGFSSVSKAIMAVEESSSDKGRQLRLADSADVQSAASDSDLDD